MRRLHTSFAVSGARRRGIFALFALLPGAALAACNTILENDIQTLRASTSGLDAYAFADSSDGYSNDAYAFSDSSEADTPHVLPDAADAMPDAREGSAPCLLCPAPLAKGRNRPLNLAASATHLYWAEADQQHVYRVPKVGGAVEDVSGPGGAWFVATDDAHVFWTDTDGSKIYGAPLAGGAPSLLASDPAGAGAYALTSDGAFVYWTNHGTGQIFKVDIDRAHTVTPVVASARPTGIVAKNANTLFWLEFEHLVMRADGHDDAYTTTPLTSSANVEARFIAVDGYAVYYTMGKNGSVWTVSQTGGVARAISSDESDPRDIAVDGSGVYWTNKALTGSHPSCIRHATRVASGWIVETIADAQMAPVGIALDDAQVYWTTDGTDVAGDTSGTIMRLAK